MTPTIADIERFFGTATRVSTWVEVRQEDINGFADVTGDDDWMHTDPDRARAEGLGGTIAFGFWTLALLTRFMRNVLGAPYPPGARLGFNYGLNRVRFVAPIPVGSRVRAALTLSGVREKEPRQFLVTLQAEIEVEQGANPAMVAEWLVLFVYP